jgi:hypothetical protein
MLLPILKMNRRDCDENIESRSINERLSELTSGPISVIGSANLPDRWRSSALQLGERECAVLGQSSPAHRGSLVHPVSAWTFNDVAMILKD